MNEFLMWLGWGSAGNGYATHSAFSFWSSPLGLLCTFTLCMTSMYRTLHHKSNADLFDTLWHMMLTMAAGAAFIIGLQNSSSQHVVKTLVVLMAVRGFYKALQLHFKARREKRKQRA